MDIVSLVYGIAERSGWPQPLLNFSTVDDIIFGSALLGNQLVTSQGICIRTIKKHLCSKLHALILKNEVRFPKNLQYFNSGLEGVCGALGGGPGSNSGPLPQLNKKKKNKIGGAANNARKYAKFVNKVGRNFFKACPHCKHLNFKRYESCLKCEKEIGPEEEDEETTFFDVERASGPPKSDPIQIGLVKYSYKLDTITEKLEMNIKTEERIDKWCSENLHGIRNINGTLFKKGKKLENVVSQREAIEMFEKFISDSKCLICHDAVVPCMFNTAKYFPYQCICHNFI